MVRAGRVGSLLGLGIIALLTITAAIGDETATERSLQIYGLTLDDTRLGDGFCESEAAASQARCAQGRPALPPLAAIEVQILPAPHVVLSLAAAPEQRPETVRIWYAPRERGGQSFMIATATASHRDLAGAREDVLQAFGAPTVEFTHADMEATGIHLRDLMVDTLLYVDRALPDAKRARIAHRLRTEFNPSGAELFSLTDSTLRTLARLLGSDFRGAIVQISESGWTHQSTVTTILLDLQRAQTVFRLGG